MPRTGRGGSRTGTPGSRYPNRTDLAGPVPNQAAPGQTYGRVQDEQAAQRQVPVAPPPVVTGLPGGPNAPAPPGSGLPAPGGGAAGAPPFAAPAPGRAPGELPWLGPSQRPNEPITAGLPMGPGPGPEALTGLMAQGADHTNATQLLQQLARIPGASKEVQQLAQYAASGRS
jgi:hypothetical protein